MTTFNGGIYVYGISYALCEFSHKPLKFENTVHTDVYAQFKKFKMRFSVLYDSYVYKTNSFICFSLRSAFKYIFPLQTLDFCCLKF